MMFLIQLGGALFDFICRGAGLQYEIYMLLWVNVPINKFILIIAQIRSALTLIFSFLLMKSRKLNFTSEYGKLQKSYLFFNGSAIRHLTPPPSSLIAVGTLAVGEKSSFFLNGTAFNKPL